jgi:ATP-dependent DNA helicase Rep
VKKGRFTAGVGGDDQSTALAWRTLDTRKKLPVDYPTEGGGTGAKTTARPALRRAANNVIGPNPCYFPKTLFSELG